MSWLLLIHQLPARRETARVRIWRMLQRLGAIPVKNSVYALPDAERTKQGFKKISEEIRSSGGEAVLVSGDFLSGIDPDSLVQEYNRRLRGEYQGLSKEMRSLRTLVSRAESSEELMKVEHVRGKLLSQLAELSERNYFDSGDEIDLEKQMKEIEQALASRRRRSSKKTPSRISGATWVTRKDPHVDRLASAWLIRRFIDSKARVRFVDMDTYRHRAGDLRFDVFGGEYTHEGELCTFEVLIRRFGLRKNRGLTRLAEVIHDLDLKDEKHSRPETEGIRCLLAGLILSEKNDEERAEKAALLFDGVLSELSRRK